jgi:integrase/recombinase XerD
MTAEEGIHALLAHLRLKGYRPATIHNYSDQLKRFRGWLRRRRIGDLRALSRARLLGYQADVRREPISRETQALRIRAVKRLYGYLVEEGHLLLDPTEGLQEISRRNALPKPVLSLMEMKALLAAPDVMQPHGLRDRALLEVLYATGVRVGELQQVVCTDLNLREGTMHLRVTKSGQPRVVPLGHHAIHWLQRYLDEVRPWQVRHRPFEPALFVVKGGRALRAHLVRQALKQYARGAGIQKTVSPHLLRHSCATHMLRAGAPIRHLQEMLGHASIETTQVYTRVTITDLKAVHRRFHPREQDPEEGKE